MAAKIVAEALSKTFPAQARGAGDVTVLDGFELTINEGEFVSVLGPSGCGKSTFLNILAGLETASSGSLLIDGSPLRGVSRKIGVVFQGYALFPWRTVVKNVESGLEIRGVGKAERREIAAAHLERVGLGDFLDHYPHQLSGGMRQRVAIVRALAYDPEILVMDEPFAALDAQTREQLQYDLLNIWGEQGNHKTVVFVTHSIDEAVFLSDRVAIVSPRPGHVRTILDISLPRPRTEEVRNSEEFVHLRARASDALKEEYAYVG